jgi:hypothetical protein
VAHFLHVAAARAERVNGVRRDRELTRHLYTEHDVPSPDRVQVAAGAPFPETGVTPLAATKVRMRELITAPHAV